MSVNILIQDMYLDFTCSKDISLERRFFVEIELNKNNQEVLVFMNEMNSVFEKTEKLTNMVLLNNKDLAYEFSEENTNNKTQEHKELLIVEKEKIYSILSKMVIHNLESRHEDVWLSFCAEIYNKRKVEFTLDSKKRELAKYHASNEQITKLWKHFPESMKEYTLGGDLMKSKTIPHTLAKFWSEAYFLHLSNKLENKNLKEKKPKI